MIDVGIYGASGYGGQELLRYLMGHAQVRVAFVTSTRFAEQPVSRALPSLLGFYDSLHFELPEKMPPASVKAVFLAMPHGASKSVAQRLALKRPDVAIIDLSMDFRDESDGFVYGLTETNRERLQGATRVANPGCFATGALLALAPLSQENLIAGPALLSQTTGSSGGGATVKAGTHHPERAQDMRAYKVLTHQHEPEIAADMARLGSDAVAWMVPQSGPFARGIFTVAHVRLKRDADVFALYEQRYQDEPFVRLREGTPTLRHVARTNFCDIAVHQRDDRVVILSAIDNLGKGMAGQAIQNFNVVSGLPETAGIRVPGANA